MRLNLKVGDYFICNKGRLLKLIECYDFSITTLYSFTNVDFTEAIQFWDEDYILDNFKHLGNNEQTVRILYSNYQKGGNK